MKCEDLLKLLNEYVDGTLDPTFCTEFEKHMAGCNPCQVVVDNLRQTITLYKAGEPYELPAPFRDRGTKATHFLSDAFTESLQMELVNELNARLGDLIFAVEVKS